MDKLAIAPSTSPISMAFAVPNAWEEEPRAMPFAMGLVMCRSLRNGSQTILPTRPVRITTGTVMAG